MALALDDLTTWLLAQDIAGVVSSDTVLNWMPDTPDEVVVVAVSGGTGTILEGAFETQHLSVRCRAATDADAEALALLVHAAFSTDQGSKMMGATYVLTTEPMTAPQFFSRDVSNRTTYTAGYAVTTATL